MATGMCIPLLVLPRGVEELGQTVSSAFLEFGWAPPVVRLNMASEKESGDLLSSFIMVDGTGEEAHCWVSIDACSPEVADYPGSRYLAEVLTRGDLTFAALVAFSLARQAGTVVFDDAHQLGREDEYTPEALHGLLVARLESTK